MKLAFSKGASPKDPAGLFNASLDGRVRSAIDIHEVEEVRTLEEGESLDIDRHWGGDGMKISARVDNSFRKHAVTLTRNNLARELSIAPNPDGFGSSANGGELLCLALATCYCNALYREAKKRGIEIHRVEVEVEGTFGAEGAPAERFAYHARVSAKASHREIIELMQHTDSVAEIQNTLRRSCPVLLTGSEALEAG